MIAIIPARGGSKGLPRKNVLPLCGKPLIAYTIEAANNCPTINRTVVSTDDLEIAEVARQHGAEVPFIRPPYLATDAASSKDTMLHALKYFADEGSPLESFCLLQPTSPLRGAGDLSNALALFKERKASSVLSVVEYDHPIQWAVGIEPDGHMTPREDDSVSMRQQAELFYRPNGAIYIFETAFFRKAESYYGADTYAYIMPQARSVDIDTYIDFMLAESILKHWGKDGD